MVWCGVVWCGVVCGVYSVYSMHIVYGVTSTCGKDLTLTWLPQCPALCPLYLYPAGRAPVECRGV